MKYITGNNRNQMQFFSLEEYIHQDNEVRLIDLFVNSLDLQQFGFELNFSHTGRPPYHPKDLLKLYLYGYLNRIRSYPPHQLHLAQQDNPFINYFACCSFL